MVGVSCGGAVPFSGGGDSQGSMVDWRWPIVLRTCAYVFGCTGIPIPSLWACFFIRVGWWGLYERPWGRCGLQSKKPPDPVRDSRAGWVPHRDSMGRKVNVGTVSSSGLGEGGGYLLREVPQPPCVDGVTVLDEHVFAYGDVGHSLDGGTVSGVSWGHCGGPGGHLVVLGVRRRLVRPALWLLPFPVLFPFSVSGCVG